MRPTPDGTAKDGSDGDGARATRHLRSQLDGRRLNTEVGKHRDTSAFGDYVCECGIATCSVPVSLTPEEFAAIRAQPGQFVVYPGHVTARLERVVESNERFQVVESVYTSIRWLVSQQAAIAEGSAETPPTD